jgi:hypothetical protein
MDHLEENDVLIIDEDHTCTKEYYDSTEKNREEDQIAYNELKAEGFDFFAPSNGSFSVHELLSSMTEHELKEMREKFEDIMNGNDFYEIALCSTKEGFEYLQRQILSKAKCKRVIDGKGDGKSGGFMRVRG